MVDYYKDKLFVKHEVKRLTESQAAIALYEAWKMIYGVVPTVDQLALLWAQSALETARWKEINNNNFGNIKKKHAPNDDGHNFTMVATGEYIWNNSLKKSIWKWFTPPDPETHFRSYSTVTDGAKDYISLLNKKTRYAKVWAVIMRGGSPAEFSHELAVAGYYTAKEELYTKGVVSLTNEFKKKSKDLLDGTITISERKSNIFSDKERNDIMVSTNLTIEEYFSYSNNGNNSSDIDDRNKDISNYDNDTSTFQEIKPKKWTDNLLGWMKK
jgi:hypothetical protein